MAKNRITQSSIRSKIIRLRRFGFRPDAIAKDCGLTIEQIRAVLSGLQPNQKRKVRRRKRKREAENKTAWLLLKEGNSVETIAKSFPIGPLQRARMARYIELNQIDAAENRAKTESNAAQ